MLAHCDAIEMMNQVDSKILVESITGTSPINGMHNLIDYFNESTLISYDSKQYSPYVLIILKSKIVAEIQKIALVHSTTNIKRFKVDLIDDYKSIVQTVHSNANLIAEGFTEVAIAAIRVTYLEMIDENPAKNIRLSVQGCFGLLPSPRSTTTTVASTTKNIITTISASITTRATSTAPKVTRKFC